MQDQQSYDEQLDAFFKPILEKAGWIDDTNIMVAQVAHRIPDVKLIRRIVDIFVELDTSELLHMRENSEYLIAKVDETVPIARERQQMFRERLFPLIKSMFPDQAQQITDMLLNLHGSTLLLMLESGRLRHALKEKVHDMIFSAVFPIIQSMFQDLDRYGVVKITRMLLERHSSELLYMLENRESLKAKVDEVVAVLDQAAHQVCTVLYQGDVTYL